MKVCCAERMIRECVRDMWAEDPVMCELAADDFMFTNEELFKALQLRHSMECIQDIIDTLVPELRDGNPCTCGTTDPTICGVAFIAIVDEMFQKPPLQ